MGDAGYCFARLKDQAGNILYLKEFASISQYGIDSNSEEVILNMPDADVTLTLEVGHLGAVDESKTFTVKTTVPQFPWALAIVGGFLSVAVAKLLGWI